MRSALLIIDVQQALCVGEWAAFEADAVIERINTVSRKARAAAIPVVVVQHETEGGQDMDPGSEGWKLAPTLETDSADLFVGKKASDAFHQTELPALLAARGVRSLIVCGLQTEYCVDTTVRRALALGYPVALISDAHTTFDNGVLSAAQIRAHHNLTLSNLDSFGPRVTLVSAQELHIAG